MMLWVYCVGNQMRPRLTGIAELANFIDYTLLSIFS